MGFPCHPIDFHVPPFGWGSIQHLSPDIFENQDVGVTELECFERDAAIGGAVVF